MYRRIKRDGPFLLMLGLPHNIYSNLQTPVYILFKAIQILHSPRDGLKTPYCGRVSISLTYPLAIGKLQSASYSNERRRVFYVKFKTGSCSQIHPGRVSAQRLSQSFRF